MGRPRPTPLLNNLRERRRVDFDEGRRFGRKAMIIYRCDLCGETKECRQKEAEGRLLK